MAGNLLALDLASVTGWCVASLDAKPAPSPLQIAGGAMVDKHLSGSTDFRNYAQGDSKKGRYYGRLYHEFRNWFDDMMTVHNPEYVVFEAAVPFHKSQQAARVLLYLIGCVEEVCYLKGIGSLHCFEVNVQHVKKHATGKGNADKNKMIRAGRDRGWKFADDNECDALWLADYALACLKGKNQ